MPNLANQRDICNRCVNCGLLKFEPTEKPAAAAHLSLDVDFLQRPSFYVVLISSAAADLLLAVRSLVEVYFFVFLNASC
ncbi:hypothetical protein F2Q68_00017314 [Brassica cretica]|uniref:Uncharacterized protein n=2 Tax=Brassica cretica TaxID=69181 RepID=A0A3N6S1G6_BRACR|nr:hypothetical protein F2Q68_00017314 [Brassica cretica]KAF3604925.1 hypothetical protein DY000_02050030 [Brassica cretica]